jgi:hypothetical protein
MTQGYPFLVARGRRRGYRTILAPAFLTERRLHGVLADSANGEQMNSGHARRLELDRPDVGRLTLVYRTEQVTAGEVDGGRGDGLATDEHGRPLEILYGVVCCGRLRGRVEDADLGLARGEALASYRRFLAEEDGFGVAASDPIPLGGVSLAPDVEPAPPDDPSPPSFVVRRMVAVAAVGLAALLAVTLLPGLLRGGTAHVVGVQARLSASGAVDCTSPVSVDLIGKVTMDGAGNVVYRWETNGSRHKSHRLAFKHAGTHALPVERYLTDTLPAEGYTLVIEAPERTRVQAPQTLQCLPPPADIPSWPH